MEVLFSVRWDGTEVKTGATACACGRGDARQGSEEVAWSEADFRAEFAARLVAVGEPIPCRSSEYEPCPGLSMEHPALYHEEGAPLPDSGGVLPYVAGTTRVREQVSLLSDVLGDGVLEDRGNDDSPLPPTEDEFCDAIVHRRTLGRPLEQIWPMGGWQGWQLPLTQVTAASGQETNDSQQDPWPSTAHVEATRRGPVRRSLGSPGIENCQPPEVRDRQRSEGSVGLPGGRESRASDDAGEKVAFTAQPADSEPRQRTEEVELAGQTENPGRAAREGKGSRPEPALPEPWSIRSGRTSSDAGIQVDMPTRARRLGEVASDTPGQEAHTMPQIVGELLAPSSETSEKETGREEVGRQTRIARGAPGMAARASRPRQATVAPPGGRELAGWPAEPGGSAAPASKSMAPHGVAPIVYDNDRDGSELGWSGAVAAMEAQSPAPGENHRREDAPAAIRESTRESERARVMEEARTAGSPAGDPTSRDKQAWAAGVAGEVPARQAKDRGEALIVEIAEATAHDEARVLPKRAFLPKEMSSVTRGNAPATAASWRIPATASGVMRGEAETLDAEAADPADAAAGSDGPASLVRDVEHNAAPVSKIDGKAGQVRDAMPHGVGSAGEAPDATVKNIRTPADKGAEKPYAVTTRDSARQAPPAKTQGKPILPVDEANPSETARSARRSRMPQETLDSALDDDGAALDDIALRGVRAFGERIATHAEPTGSRATASGRPRAVVPLKEDLVGPSELASSPRARLTGPAVKTLERPALDAGVEDAVPVRPGGRVAASRENTPGMAAQADTRAVTERGAERVNATVSVEALSEDSEMPPTSEGVSGDCSEGCQNPDIRLRAGFWRSAPPFGSTRTQPQTYPDVEGKQDPQTRLALRREVCHPSEGSRAQEQVPRKTVDPTSLVPLGQHRQTSGRGVLASEWEPERNAGNPHSLENDGRLANRCLAPQGGGFASAQNGDTESAEPWSAQERGAMPAMSAHRPGPRSGDTPIAGTTRRPVQRGDSKQVPAQARTRADRLAPVDRNAAPGSPHEAGTREVQQAEQSQPSTRSIIDQIVQRAELRLGRSEAEMVIDLEPDSLGRVHLKITAESGRVLAEIRADSAATRSLIEAGLPELKTALAGRGLSLEAIAVSADAGSKTTGDGAKPRWYWEDSTRDRANRTRSGHHGIRAVGSPALSWFSGGRMHVVDCMA